MNIIISPLITKWMDSIYEIAVSNLGILPNEVEYYKNLIDLAVRSCNQNKITLPDQLNIFAEIVKIRFFDGDYSTPTKLFILPKAEIRIFIEQLQTLYPAYNGWFSADYVRPECDHNQLPQSYSYRFKTEIDNDTVKLLFSDGIFYSERFDEVSHVIPLETPLGKIDVVGEVSLVECIIDGFTYFEENIQEIEFKSYGYPFDDDEISIDGW